MRQFLLISTIIFSQLFYGFSQTNADVKHSKVKVNLIGKDVKLLVQNGLETDHGIFVKNRYLISDFSDAEIAIMRSLGFQFEILIADVGAYYADANRSSEVFENTLQARGNCEVSASDKYNYTTPANYKDGTMGGYFTYQEMIDILDSMATKYPNLITFKENIEPFTTYRNNKIFYVKVSDNPSADETTEPKVLYTALHHAREPNSLSQMIFYLWYLLENYGSDPTVTKIVNETQMFFVPCVNPDGYKLNQTNKPNGGGNWRKNTWVDSLGVLKGVDLNRNYGYFWGFDNSGSSINPGSETFRGLSAFSEPETQAVRALCLQHDFELALNYHTFGNFLIHPWGYNDEPTAEDKVFKAMGKMLNKENDFFLGTGTETVNYVTNGDSDDWMYGEVGEKKKIYSYTPEVGPSFWPPKTDIDFLNRSCVWMNLSLPLLTLNHYEAIETNVNNYFNPNSKNIYVKVTRTGLKEGAATITLKSLTQGVVVTNPTRSITLAQGDAEELVFSTTVDETKTYPDGIRFELILNNDGLIKIEEIKKNWISKTLNTIYFDELTNANSFAPSTWETTVNDFYSSPSSITDSKDGNYLANIEEDIVLLKAVDLSKVEQSYLNFYAKWDIENNYDFVQVMASEDNVDFIPLCGKYTNFGTKDQILNNPLYDGTQATWVAEEIDLKDFVGKESVWIKFKIVSDEFAQRDGFYFDDLEIRGTEKEIINGTSNIQQQTISIFPNVISKEEVCHLKGYEPSGNTSIQLRNSIGALVFKKSINAPSFDLNPNNLTNGVYIVELLEDNKKIATQKFIILK